MKTDASRAVDSPIITAEEKLVSLSDRELVAVLVTEVRHALWGDELAPGAGRLTDEEQGHPMRMPAGGLRTASVCVERDNPAALKLYESVGFEPVRKIMPCEKAGGKRR